MTGKLQVELLADHTEAIPVLKSWFEIEWGPYYGPDGPGDAEKDLRESCNRIELPISMLAIEDSEILGTAALKAHSVSTHQHLSPWLAALLVRPESRRRGIAGRLIAAVEEQARQRGFHVIYVGTGQGSGTPESALRNRGWEFIEKRPYFVSDVSIYRKAL